MEKIHVYYQMIVLWFSPCVAWISIVDACYRDQLFFSIYVFSSGFFPSRGLAIPSVKYVDYDIPNLIFSIYRDKDISD